MDMLIKLYDLPAAPTPLRPDIVVRKPIGPEHDVLIAWVAEHWSAPWASETRVALGNRPVSVYMSVQADKITGFCCYDATARAFIGPIGVLESARKSGVGAHLLRACLDDMRGVGYGYAIVGWVGAPEFFARVAGATPITGSEPKVPGADPSVYRGMVRREPS